VNEDERLVWRTNSEIKWTFVTAPTVSAGMVQMARVLDDFDLEPYVTDIKMEIGDDGVVTIGALTEIRRGVDA
jgi:hypothetical protein